MSYKKFTQNIGILGLTQTISAVISIAELSVITKLLGAQNYGIWVQLTVTISMLAPLILLGLPYTLVRFLAGEKDKEKIKEQFWSVFFIISCAAIVISALLIIFSKSVSLLFGCPKIFVIILAPIIIFECLNQTLLNVFRAFQEIKKYSFFTIFRNISEGLLIILAIFLGYGILGAICMLLSMEILLFLIMISLLTKRIGLKIPNFSKTKEHLAFGLPPILADISYWIIQSSDKYLVSFFLGSLFVGYYAPPYTLGSFVAFFLSPLGFLLPATLSKYHDENKIDEVKTHLKFSLKYFLMLTIPAVFGISILSKQLLTIFSTPLIAQESYYLIPFISFSMLLFGLTVIFDQALALKKKTKISGFIWIVAALLNFTLNLMLIPIFGILGAAITTLLAYGLAAGLTWYYSFREIQFEIDWKFIIKSVFASILMSIFILVFNPAGLWKTIISIITGAFLYFVFVYLFKGFSKNEMHFVKEFF